MVGVLNAPVDSKRDVRRSSGVCGGQHMRGKVRDGTDTGAVFCALRLVAYRINGIGASLDGRSQVRVRHPALRSCLDLASNSSISRHG